MSGSKPRLLSLPNELQVEILAVAALWDATVLANVSQCCKALYDLVYKQQNVWREIFLFHYDNPAQACAFLTPRTSYDWRQTFIDRRYVRDALKWKGLGEEPSVLDPESGLEDRANPEWQRLARLVFKTVLGMYLDLPSLDADRPSLNARVLPNMVENGDFRQLYSHKASVLDRDAYHLLALLPGRTLTYNDFINYHGNVRPTSATRPPDDETDWFGIGVDVGLVENVTSSLLQPNEGENWRFVDPNIVQHTLQGVVEPVRGTGLLGLRPPADLGPTDVFDWPGIRGRWHLLRCDKEHVKLAAAWEDDIPRLFQQTTFDLVPVPDRAALCTAYTAASGRDEDLAIPFAHPDPTRGLSPVYFYGQSRSGPASDARRQPEFVFGVAGLTADNPPQIRWDWATIGLGLEETKSVFRGVHVGGRGAKKGVFGSWKRILPVHATTTYEQLQNVTIRGVTTGMAWFVKDIWTTTSGKGKVRAV